MIGFGNAHNQQDGLAVAVNVRVVASRLFKLTVRATDGYSALEPYIEKVARQSIRRGTIKVNLRVDRLRQELCINSHVLSRYRDQLLSLARVWGDGVTISSERLLRLPGVVADHSMAVLDADVAWPAISTVLEAAIQDLSQMRLRGGRAMTDDLLANCRDISVGIETIQQRAPSILDASRRTLIERVNRVLAENQLSIGLAEIIRGVSLYADRSDVSEEIARLKCYLEQFGSIMQLTESSGRKLEFLTQEMLREANTIGSKLNDVDITANVIEIKSAIERICEITQNVE
jgi:uncharacterized protein (TIGR00255 family)